MGIVPDSRSAVAGAAVEYAKQGLTPIVVWGVADGRCQCVRGVGCPSPGKHPRFPQWELATRDPAEVARSFAAAPGCNVGLLLGPAGGLIDVEFDDEEGELTAARVLNGGTLTPTFTSKRSTHRLYRWRDLGIDKAVAKVCGLEIRLGSGGRAAQSVAPPSSHASGEPYQWLTGLSPAEVPLAELPAAVLEMLRTPPAEAAPQSAMEFIVLDNDLATAPGVGEGQRNQRLCSLIGTYLATRGADGDLVPQALAWGDRCQPPLSHDEVLRTVAAICQRHQRKQPQQAPAGLAYRRYAAIPSRPVEWVWPGRFPLGKLSLLVGEPGVGKTHLLCDLIACVTTGRVFADNTFPHVGDCAVLTCEDDPEDTLRPRLEAAGADLDRVFHIDGVRTASQAPDYLNLEQHLPAIEAFLDEHPGLVLFAFDPISAFCGRIDGNSNSEVRSILGPLSRLAEQRRVAVLGISHLNKSTEGKAVNRVVGSVGWIAAARACWRVGIDPDCEDGETRIFTAVKNNLANTPGLAYRLIDGRVAWEDRQVYVLADDLDEAGGSPRDEVADWLQTYLESGPQPADAVMAKAKALGFRERTLRRAKKGLGVCSHKGSGGAWEWALPNDVPEPDDSDGAIFTF